MSGAPAGALDGDGDGEWDDAFGEGPGACTWTPTAVAMTARRMAASAGAGAMVQRLLGLSCSIDRPEQGGSCGRVTVVSSTDGVMRTCGGGDLLTAGRERRRWRPYLWRGGRGHHLAPCHAVARGAPFTIRIGAFGTLPLVLVGSGGARA